MKLIFIKIVALTLIVFVFCIPLMVFINNNNPIKIVVKPIKVKSLEQIKWEKLTNSIIYIESTDNDSAVNKGDCIGCLQISPIYIKEVNRILKLKHIDKTYNLSDRYNRKKSIEMFNIVQDYRNPKHDFHKAIRLHNPTAGKWYENRIMKHYNKLN